PCHAPAAQTRFGCYESRPERFGLRKFRSFDKPAQFVIRSVRSSTIVPRRGGGAMGSIRFGSANRSMFVTALLASGCLFGTAGGGGAGGSTGGSAGRGGTGGSAGGGGTVGTGGSAGTGGAAGSGGSGGGAGAGAAAGAAGASGGHGGTGGAAGTAGSGGAAGK